MIHAFAETLGAGDCERLLGTGLVQPVNAWSSLAYAVVGLALIVSARWSDDWERTVRFVFGLLLIATGIGSFLYHGSQPAGAGFVHDITFLAALWFLILVNGGSALGWGSRMIWGAFAASLVLMTALLLGMPTATNILTGVSVVALIGSDLLLHRVGGLNGRWYATALVLFAGSLIANVLGRTGGPACVPGSLIQPHALWHVLSAAVLGAYFVATARPRRQEPSP